MVDGKLVEEAAGEYVCPQGMTCTSGKSRSYDGQIWHNPNTEFPTQEGMYICINGKHLFVLCQHCIGSLTRLIYVQTDARVKGQVQWNAKR
jgi:hypothetical protein